MADQGFQAKLQALRDAFTREVPHRLEALDHAWAPKNADAAGAALFLAHRLAGAGATFGHSSTSEAARTLEDLLRPLAASPTPALAEKDQERVDEALRFLRAAARKDLDRGLGAVPVAAPEPAPVQDLVVFSGDDPELCQDLARQMENLGYDLKVAAPFEVLDRELDGVRPRALVVATDFPEGHPWTDGRLQDLLRKRDLEPALVFVSHQEDFRSRLASVQAGSAAYFLLPLDTTALVSRLDALCGQPLGDPYAVVLVEDDPMVLEEHALILENAGMRVARVQDPMQILQAIGGLRPDLILLDWYMPGCSGPDLAAVLRQMESLVGVPLVFLSAERNLDRQMSALSKGGDDFLTKPIWPEHLVAAVTARAQRGRVLRSFMIRDSLTGLYNHTALKEQLDQALGMAQRRLAPLSFAILDLDHFKLVNDTHGHPMGDRVIMNLTRLMQLRLRRTDILGRYGGEEFGIILPDTTPEQARQVVEDLLEAFRQLRFPPGADDAFQCTFSAGISAYPALGDREQLIAAADAALYRAKNAGRARVMLAD
ncbi:MAG TPA: diguanylate cyclase [Holophagaceae bacterium]|nr:diguanylate cyclase [Holophagaceae bacterium]